MKLIYTRLNKHLIITFFFLNLHNIKKKLKNHSNFSTFAVHKIMK